MSRRSGQTARESAVPDVIGAAIAAGALVIGAVRAPFRPVDRGSSSPDTAAPPGSSSEPSTLDPFDPHAAGVEKPRGAKAKLVAFAERKRWRWMGRTLELQQRVK